MGPRQSRWWLDSDQLHGSWGKYDWLLVFYGVVTRADAFQRPASGEIDGKVL